MGLKHKKKLILWYALVILIIPVLAYVASVAINDQTKTTDVATDDVFPLYDTSATAGRGITGQNLASGLAAIITEGDLTDSSVVSADIKDGTVANADMAANAVLSNELGNPDGNDTLTMGNYSLKWDWTTDNPSSAITFFELESDALVTDTDVVFFWLQGDANGTPKDILKISGATTRPTVTGDATWNFSTYNLSSIDSLKINNTNFDEVDPSWETGISGTTLTMTGAIVGALKVYAAAGITSDTFVGQEEALRGTLVTNQGDADGETWELPVCTTPTAGFHAKILCAATQDIVLDAGAASTIYVSDGTSIVNAQGDDDNVTLDCANVGESAIIYSFSTDGSTCDWMVECGAGTCTEGAP